MSVKGVSFGLETNNRPMKTLEDLEASEAQIGATVHMRAVGQGLEESQFYGRARKRKISYDI